MDIFLLLPSCGWCVNQFHFIFLFCFSSIFNFSFCGFKISFSFSWVASLGIRVILPLVINNFNIIGYTETLSIRGQVFAQNLNFSPKSTFFWICKIPDSVETLKSNFKSKFCWHGRRGPRASKKEF